MAAQCVFKHGRMHSSLWWQRGLSVHAFWGCWPWLGRVCDKGVTALINDLPQFSLHVQSGYLESSPIKSLLD